MRRLIAVAAACALGACATGPAPQTSTVVRTRPPAHVEPTVSSYFDLTVPGPQSQRKLVFGAAEASPCPLSTGGGVHLGWMVPVVYDTTAGPAERKPAAASATSAAANATTTTAPTATTSAAAARRQAKPRAGASGSTSGGSSTNVGASPSAAGSASTGTSSTTPADSNVTLTEVSISGTRYFFWFSADTLSGVTRRADLCP